MRAMPLTCSDCGAPITTSSRSGLCRSCVVSGERHPRWQGDNATPHSKRGRAREMYDLIGVTCESCGSHPAVERHHIDGNTGNNDRSNVRFLCQNCHRVPHKLGESNPAAKLTTNAVHEIRAQYVKGGISQKALGELYGISQAQVSNIVLGKKWPN